MSGSLDISIVIVNWNTCRLLLSCIASIKRYTQRVAFEIVVVDNGSSDNTVASVRRNFPNIKVIACRENVGFSRANNIGIAACSGRHICIMNSDIELIEPTLDLLVSYADRHEKVGVVAPLTVDGMGRIRENCRKLPSLLLRLFATFQLDKLPKPFDSTFSRTIPARKYNGIVKAESVSGCFMVVKQEVIDQVGLLDERFFFYSEDIDWCKRIREAGWEVIFHSGTRAVHYGGKSSSRAPIRFQVQIERAKLQYWQKHHNDISVKIYRLLKVLGYSIVLMIRMLHSAVLKRDKSNFWYRGFLARLRFVLNGK